MYVYVGQAQLQLVQNETSKEQFIAPRVVLP